MKKTYIKMELRQTDRQTDRGKGERKKNEKDIYKDGTSK